MDRSLIKRLRDKLDDARSGVDQEAIAIIAEVDAWLASGEKQVEGYEALKQARAVLATHKVSP